MARPIGPTSAMLVGPANSMNSQAENDSTLPCNHDQFPLILFLTRRDLIYTLQGVMALKLENVSKLSMNLLKVAFPIPVQSRSRDIVQVIALGS